MCCSSQDPYNFFDTSRKCSNVINGINQQIPQHGDHPTPKPIVLMERLVKIHSVEKQTVIDPFMGSGTTGVACHNLNRNFIGIEIDKEYFQIAKKRIEDAQRQQRLFVPESKKQAEQLSL